MLVDGRAGEGKRWLKFFCDEPKQTDPSFLKSRAPKPQCFRTNHFIEIKKNRGTEWAATGSEILQATESEEPEKAEKKANPLELL